MKLSEIEIGQEYTLGRIGLKPCVAIDIRKVEVKHYPNGQHFNPLKRIERRVLVQMRERDATTDADGMKFVPARELFDIDERREKISRREVIRQSEERLERSLTETLVAAGFPKPSYIFAEQIYGSGEAWRIEIVLRETCDEMPDDC